MRRILVVEHQSDAGLGQLGERFIELGIELVTVQGPAVRELGINAESLHTFDGLIVLGGAMGPGDDTAAPWLPATRQLLALAVEQQLPTLGICLGAQLLTVALGGEVRTMENGPEIGLHTVTLNEAGQADLLLGSLSDSAARDGVALSELPVVQWHWLECATLAKGAVLLAGNAHCAHQAFRVGERAWGLQFHPEALADAAEAWSTIDDVSEYGLDAATVIAEIATETPRLRTIWRQLADRFAALTV